MGDCVADSLWCWVMVADKLMIVAHPDDESLFGGSLLLGSGGWLVVCLTNGDNVVRRAEFAAAMGFVGAEWVMFDCVDKRRFDLDLDFILPSLREIILGRSWSMVVTHGCDGEYGHRHHRQLYGVVRGFFDVFWCFERGELLPDDVWLRKLELLSFYVSQAKVCASHFDFARRESVRELVFCL